MGDKPFVSVVIPTKNAEETIETCLKSLKKQTYPNIEVVVVDSYSCDGTKGIAEKFGAKFIQSEAGRARARNLGAKELMGELILSLDSDMELTPIVIEECVNKVEESYDAVIIPEVSVGVGFWAKCKALEKSCYLGDESIEALRFCKRDVFEAVKGYDPELEAGEDWDLDQRIRKAGFHVGRTNSVIKHNEGRLSLWKTMKKKYHYGKTLEKYRRKNPNEASQQLRLVRPAFVKNWRKLARDPIHALGMFFMKTCELGAAKLGVWQYT